MDVVTSFEPVAGTPSSPCAFIPIDHQKGDYCSFDYCSEKAASVCTRCRYALCESCTSSHATQQCSGEADSISSSNSNVGVVSGSRSNGNDNGKKLSAAQQKKELAAKRALLKTALFGSVYVLELIHYFWGLSQCAL